MTKIGRKGKKIIIIASVCIVVLTGAILGGVFGIKAKQEKDWQALQGHDTSLIWVNINNMIAEPVNIEGDLYDYEHYVVEVPNTTQLCVQSYKVGKDATANFYHDENCENKIENIKAIDCSDDSYAKTLYMKIVSQKGDERKIKLDITVDNYLVPGTIRKANPDGHIEIPNGVNEITMNDSVYRVIRQENLNDLYDDPRGPYDRKYILAEDILIDGIVKSIYEMDGNNFQLNISEEGIYVLEEGFDDPSHRQYDCIFYDAEKISNINFNGRPDRLVYLAMYSVKTTQIKAYDASLVVEAVRGTAEEKVEIKNCIIFQANGPNFGFCVEAVKAKLFNLVNYTDNNAKLTDYLICNGIKYNYGEKSATWYGCSGGICALARETLIVNCYNFLDTEHSNVEGGILGLSVNCTIVHCNNYGDFYSFKKNRRRPDYNVVADHFKYNDFQIVGGILGDSLTGSGNDDMISDCNNYGDIYYDKACEAIDGIYANNGEILRCQNYGRIVKK